MLETQTSQVEEQQAPQATPEGKFPGQPQPNPRGHANVITLRCGTPYDEPCKSNVELVRNFREKCCVYRLSRGTSRA